MIFLNNRTLGFLSLTVLLMGSADCATAKPPPMLYAQRETLVPVTMEQVLSPVNELKMDECVLSHAM